MVTLGTSHFVLHNRRLSTLCIISLAVKINCVNISIHLPVALNLVANFQAFLPVKVGRV